MSLAIVRGRSHRAEIGRRPHNAIVPVVLHMQRLWCIRRTMIKVIKLNLKLHLDPIKKNQTYTCDRYVFYVYSMLHENNKDHTRIRRYQYMTPREPQDCFKGVPQCFPCLHRSLLLRLKFSTKFMYKTLKTKAWA